jgi:hypothetical protein
MNNSQQNRQQKPNNELIDKMLMNMFKSSTSNIDRYVDVNDFNLLNEPINQTVLEDLVIFVNSLYILSNTKQKYSFLKIIYSLTTYYFKYLN